MVSPDPSPSFTWNAADYARSSSSQQQWAQELIAKLRLNGNERVLDIGCGDGKVTARIAACVPLGSVTGIDNSPEMCRFAREHFPIRSAKTSPSSGWMPVILILLKNSISYSQTPPSTGFLITNPF